MGTVKHATQKALDLIRIEAEAIESTDDKYYLMKKLYEVIEDIEAQLELSEDNDINEDKLLALQANAQEVRKYIMGRPVGRKRYGLFVEYPEGYEG